MLRSGLLVVMLVAALTGCAAQPTPTPTPPPVETCPDGLTTALRAHLSSQPWNGELPTDVTVDSGPTFTFTSSLVTSIVGCTFTTEIQLASGDRMMQIFGIADDLDEEGVIAAFEEAGWEPLSGETSAWQNPEDNEEAAQIYPRGVADGHPALDFPDWTDYLGPDEVLLLGSIRF